jgi:hypothetical protein
MYVLSVTCKFVSVVVYIDVMYAVYVSECIWMVYIYACLNVYVCVSVHVVMGLLVSAYI